MMIGLSAGLTLADYNVPMDAYPVTSAPGYMNSLVTGTACNQIATNGISASQVTEPARPYYSPLSGQYFCGPTSIGGTAVAPPSDEKVTSDKAAADTKNQAAMGPLMTGIQALTAQVQAKTITAAQAKQTCLSLYTTAGVAAGSSTADAQTMAASRCPDSAFAGLSTAATTGGIGGMDTTTMLMLAGAAVLLVLVMSQ